MGNSNSSSAFSTPRTGKSSVSGSTNGSVRRKSTARSVRLGKPPQPKTLMKTSLSNQPSLNVDSSATTNGNISPTEFEANGNNIRTSRSMYELHNKPSPTSTNAPLILQNGSLKRSPTTNSNSNAPLIMNGLSPDGAENEWVLNYCVIIFANISIFFELIKTQIISIHYSINTPNLICIRILSTSN